MADGNNEEGTQAPDTSQQVADMVNTDTQTQTEPPTWNYAEGVPGQGDIPEYFKADKYANITEQAKAYRELEGKLGSFTGSPEEYSINLSKQITEQGIEINKDDPLYEEAIKFAQESNMNQDGFDNMMDLYATAKIAENKAVEEFKQQEIASLGPLGQERVNNLVSWGKANLPTDLFDGFEEMPISASAVKALEHIVSMTRSAPITPDNANGESGATTDDELRKMQFEKDEFGNRRIQTDPQFKAKFNELSKRHWGSHDHNIVIGN